jgi:hypothetical protein
MSPRSRHTEHTPFSRLVHLVLLAGWMLSTQGGAPALCLAAAVMDGEHAVKVRASQSGDVSVVLSHEGGQDAAISHQHDPLGALVVAFSQKPAEGEPDHVLSFKSVEDASRTLRRASIQVSLPAFVLVASPGSPCLSPKRVRVSSSAQFQAPAWSPGLEIKTSRMILRC